jgi:serine/threonine protein kinase
VVCGEWSDHHSPLTTPKITDFGLAKRCIGVGDSQGSLTLDGTFNGTPEYMAPEQAFGSGAIGPATDIYALGVILYELLTGRCPFEGPSALLILDQVRTQEPIAPHRLRPGLPRDLETIFLKCLCKEPGQRYRSAAELAADLHGFRERGPIHACPLGRLGRT